MSMLANIYRAEDAEAVTWESWHPHYDPPEVPEVTIDQLIAFGFKPVEASDGR